MMCHASRFQTTGRVWKYVRIKNAQHIDNGRVHRFICPRWTKTIKKNPIILCNPCVYLEARIIFLLFDRSQIIRKTLELSSTFITNPKRSKKKRFQNHLCRSLEISIGKLINSFSNQVVRTASFTWKISICDNTHRVSVCTVVISESFAYPCELGSCFYSFFPVRPSVV